MEDRLFHLALIHFPIALWLTSALFDLLYLFRRQDYYARVSFQMIGLGLLGAAASIAAGWWDLVRQSELGGVGGLALTQHNRHSLLAYGTTAVFLVSFLTRWRRPPTRNWNVALGMIGAVLVLITSYFGGELRRAI